MSSTKYLILALSFILLLTGKVWPQVTETKETSWKYIIERKMTYQDNLLKKTNEDIARAFIYYGEGSEKAGGQVKGIPQVVYIDPNNQPLTGTTHKSPPFVPFDSNKFGLISNSLSDNIGNEPNNPVTVQLLPSAEGFLPLKPEESIKQSLKWDRTIYCTPYAGMFRPELVFPVKIVHKVIGFEIKKGKNCAKIDYTIEGEFEASDETRDTRGKYALKGNGTAYYDPSEEIIVEKEQTISWTRFGERIDRLENGQVGWKPTVHDIETVSIKISIQNDKGSGSTESLETQQSSAEKPLGIFLPIAVVAIAVIVIAGLFIFLRKKKLNKTE